MSTIGTGTGSTIFFHDENLTELSVRPWPYTLGRRTDPPERTTLAAWRARIVRDLAAEFLRHTRWPSCAVVGSSGLLAHHGHGALIDRANAVFRVNAAPTRGLEKHVGSKTTYRVWGGRQTPLEHGWRGDNRSILFYCQPTPWIGRCWTHIAPNPEALPPYPRVSPFLWRGARSSIQRANPPARSTRETPTGGAIALYMALQLCQRVTIYGFGDDSNASRWNCPRRTNFRPNHQELEPLQP